MKDKNTKEKVEQTEKKEWVKPQVEVVVPVARTATNAFAQNQENALYMT